MIAILNCDLDHDQETNTACLIRNILAQADTVTVDITKEDLVSHAYDGFIVTGSRAGIDDSYEWISRLKEHISIIAGTRIPCLGICFGMQLISTVLGAQVVSGGFQETGFIDITLFESHLFRGLPSSIAIYQSHYDSVHSLPSRSRLLSPHDSCIQAYHKDNFYCLQFHPEISASVASKMAERDKKNPSEILNGMPLCYDLPSRIILNFAAICNSA